MLILGLAVSAIVPSLLLMWFFHARDVYREPPKVLWATFGLGVLTIPGVLLVVIPFMKLTGLEELTNPFASAASTAFLGAAIPEELFKALVLYAYCVRHKEFDEPMDGVVYGVVASLGFATLENVMYVTQHGVGVAILRAFTAVPGHGFCGAIMGYYAGQAKFRPQRRAAYVLASLFFPILLHGLYDFGLFAVSNISAEDHVATATETALAPVMLAIFVAALVIETVWALRVSKRLRREQIDHAIATGAVHNPLHPAAAEVAKDLKPASLFMGWLQLVPGMILGAGGGLVFLAVVISFVAGGMEDTGIGEMLMVLVVVGGLPLALGLALFVRGVRTINAAQRGLSLP